MRAKVEQISGYSAHADQFYLMDWIKSFTKIGFANGGEKHELKKIFVVQGEAGPANALASLIRDELGIESTVPEMNMMIEL